MSTTANELSSEARALDSAAEEAQGRNRHKKGRFPFWSDQRMGLIAYYAALSKVVLLAVVSTLLYSEISDRVSSEGRTAIIDGVSAVVLVLGSLLMLLYCIRISVQRLHDLNLSGWFVVALVVPVVGVVLNVVMGLVPGENKGNKYGAFIPASRTDTVLGWLAIAGVALFVLFAFLAFAMNYEPLA